MSVDPGFHPEARIEFIQAVLRLNARRPGLGDQFEAALYATVETVTFRPEPATGSPTPAP
ncbi:hypothetical protein NODU109028_09900 [Nocardioides dubius]|uniref:Uncharacterized protein n=1 Tax=Nocardioides dubius TaxID=317019 RepID=A0ABN1TN65_9ACTN